MMVLDGITSMASLWGVGLFWQEPLANVLHRSHILSGLQVLSVPLLMSS